MVEFAKKDAEAWETGVPNKVSEPEEQGWGALNESRNKTMKIKSEVGDNRRYGFWVYNYGYTVEGNFTEPPYLSELSSEMTEQYPTSLQSASQTADQMVEEEKELSNIIYVDIFLVDETGEKVVYQEGIAPDPVYSNWNKDVQDMVEDEAYTMQQTTKLEDEEVFGAKKIESKIYDVTAESEGVTRTETINTRTNKLFKDCQDKVDVRFAYESFWNDIGNGPKVRVIKVVEKVKASIQLSKIKAWDDVWGCGNWIQKLKEQGKTDDEIKKMLQEKSDSRPTYSIETIEKALGSYEPRSVVESAKKKEEEKEKITYLVSITESTAELYEIKAASEDEAVEICEEKYMEGTLGKPVKSDTVERFFQSEGTK
jgi:hypothetical protein